MFITVTTNFERKDEVDFPEGIRSLYERKKSRGEKGSMNATKALFLHGC